MRAQSLKRAGRTGGLGTAGFRAAVWAPWLAGISLCILGGALARGQASQSAPQPQTVQRDSSPQASSPQATKAAVQQPSSGPMVMGEGQDSTQDTASAPPAPAAEPLPVSGSALPAKDSVSSQPAAAPRQLSAAPAAVPIAAAAVPVAANAGGDAARQQINDECANLLKMANDLKAAVDKTTKDMLSVVVVRKANEIETLAHHVKDEMRPEVGKN